MRPSEAPTVFFLETWVEPVEQAIQLPAKAEDGSLAFVQNEDRVYVREAGKWVPEDELLVS